LSDGASGDGSELPDLEDLYQNAPCGVLATSSDGRITSVNATFAYWLGYQADEMVGRAFTDLLTGGGRIHFETHFAPLLQIAGRLSGVTLDLVAADGRRLPAFVTANVRADGDGRPQSVRLIVQDASDRRSYEQELLDERRRAEEAQTRAEELATTLRRSLLPPSLVPPVGLDAAVYYHADSPSEVGGDFYDLFPLSRDKSAFFLGDVCGKGVAAATLTSLTRYTLRAAAVHDANPEAVLHSLDAMIRREPDGSDSSRFCTVIFGVIAPRDGGFDVELASGGHPPALLLRSDGEAHYVTTPGGQAVGMFAAPKFVSEQIRLAPGDTLLLYTDGLTEARTGSGGVRFDDDGALLRFARDRTPTSADAMIRALSGLLEELGAGVDDDTALMALGVPRPS
jgi:sigma-B regulation protein RsbU (phosphoserine phosphatase)